jgi:DNA-binding response OmpR family regulator
VKILVIEDSRFLRLEIEKVLQRHGHEVTGAADGEVGLRLARTTPLQLILLDMMLPGLDGTGVLRELQRDPLTAQIPVVVLTSLSQRNEGTLKNAGAAAYLKKSGLNLDKNSELLVQVVEETARRRLDGPSGRDR